MTSPPSNLPSTFPGSSASSSRTLKPREYTNLAQGSSSLARDSSISPPSSASSSLRSSSNELRSRLLHHSSSLNELTVQEVPVCLYLLRELLEAGFPKGRRRVSGTRGKEREDAGVVVDALNELFTGVSTSQEGEEDIKEELREVLVELRVGEDGKEGRLSALHLLSHPSIALHTSFLSHPALIEAVKGLWSTGTSSSPSSHPSSSLHRLLDSLDRLCTPSRLHLLFLASRLLYILLVLALLFHPGSFVSDSQEGRPPGPWILNWKEIIWVIFSIGSIVELTTPVFTFASTLPLVAYLLALLPSPWLNSLAYPTLTLALLPLSLSLISSSSPSLPHLLPSTSLLPLSTYTSSLLRRIAKPSILFLPLALGIFIALAWSLNGDIWRLGIQLDAPGTEPPGEIGVAPFAVRLWLAIALVVVLVVWLMVGCSRCYVAAGGGEREVKEENESKDPWEEEWGREASRRARLERAKALRRYLVRESDLNASGSTPPTVNGNSVSNCASSSESQPLLVNQPSSSPLSSSRSTFQPIIPLPSPLNLLTFVFAILPNTLISNFPSSDVASRSGRVELGRRWAEKAELWIWRAVVVSTGVGPWEVVKRGCEVVKAGPGGR